MASMDLENLLSSRIESPVFLSNLERASIQARLSAEDLCLRDTPASTPGFQARLERINFIRNLLSPIRTIPFEILSKILVYASGAQRITISSPHRRRDAESIVMRNVLALTQVCAAWRTVGNETPHLWTSLSIILSRKNSDPHPVFEPAARACLTQGSWIDRWLERTKTLPLHLQLTLPRDYPDRFLFVRQIDSILSSAVQFVSRCRVLHLTARAQDVFALLQRRLHLPFLEELELDIDDTGFHLAKVLRGSSFTFIDAPRLHTVALSGTVCDILLLPGTQIASLSLRGYHISHEKPYIRLMRACPNVTCLSLSPEYVWTRAIEWDSDVVPGEDGSPSAPAVYANLQSLEILYDANTMLPLPAWEADPFVLHFTRIGAFPQLRTFRLGGKCPKADDFERQLRECGVWDEEMITEERYLDQIAKSMTIRTNSIFHSLRTGLEQARIYHSLLHDESDWDTEDGLGIVNIEFENTFWLSEYSLRTALELFPKVETLKILETVNRRWACSEDRLLEMLGLNVMVVTDDELYEEEESESDFEEEDVLGKLKKKDMSGLEHAGEPEESGSHLRMAGAEDVDEPGAICSEEEEESRLHSEGDEEEDADESESTSTEEKEEEIYGLELTRLKYSIFSGPVTVIHCVHCCRLGLEEHSDDAHDEEY